MPDRSIPFFNMILRKDDPAVGEALLPAGYTLRMYRDGDEIAWARLEREIGDFDTEHEAAQYFRDTYLYAGTDIFDRCVFAADDRGQIVGACIAWRDLRGSETAASLHWLVVSPDCRGLGIGRALCRKVLQIFARKGESPVYIHTQPWSWKAVLLYVNEGFVLQREDSFARYENQYEEAMKVLKAVLSPEQYRKLEEHSSPELYPGREEHSSPAPPADPRHSATQAPLSDPGASASPAPPTSAARGFSPALPRCRWATPKNPLYLRYHDEEWGVPCHEEQALYELFILESFQAGLSWETILNKRENFRAAFDGFDIDRVCAYGEEDLVRLMNDAGIVRNRLKIKAAVNNSRIFRAIREEYGSWNAFIWGFTDGAVIFESDPAVTVSPLSDRISKELKKRGMTFVGSTIIYAYLQAIGVICAHEQGCWKCRRD